VAVHSIAQSSLIGEYLDDTEVAEATAVLRGRLNMRSMDRGWLTSSSALTSAISSTSLCTGCTSTIRLWSPNDDLVVMRADDDAAVADRVRSSDVSFFFFI